MVIEENYIKVVVVGYRRKNISYNEMNYYYERKVMVKNEEIPESEPNLKHRVVKKYEQIKAHVQRHPKTYYIGSMIVVAGVTFLVTRRVSTRYMRIEGTTTFIHKAVVKEGPLYNVFNIYGHGLKNLGPSWMVKCDQTEVLFRSQEQCAKVMGLQKGHLSMHLNGNRPDVGGYTFTRLGVGA